MRSRKSTPSTTIFTPSTSASEEPTRQSLELGGIHQHLRDLQLASSEVPATASPQRDTPTPSIHVTPAPSRNDLHQDRASESNSLVGAMNSLRMESDSGTGSPVASRLGQSRSPTPSRRRRSSSAISAEAHRVENEELPQALFYMRQVQTALTSTKGIITRMVNVLSSSNLHLEEGSTFGNLRSLAAKLSDFQLPSSRVVGLVGDSGVGKSSLINSLLDKKGLARAVSDSIELFSGYG